MNNFAIVGLGQRANNVLRHYQRQHRDDRIVSVTLRIDEGSGVDVEFDNRIEVWRWRRANGEDQNRWVLMRFEDFDGNDIEVFHTEDEYVNFVNVEDDNPPPPAMAA